MSTVDRLQTPAHVPAAPLTTPADTHHVRFATPSVPEVELARVGAHCGEQPSSAWEHQYEQNAVLPHSTATDESFVSESCERLDSTSNTQWHPPTADSK